MAPVILHVGDQSYLNLGRSANLPGKSIAPGSPESVLTILRQTPVEQWAVEDAGLVAGLSIVLQSGPPTRVEELNGKQLLPDRIETILRRGLLELGVDIPPHSDSVDVAPSLELLAQQSATARAEAVTSGRTAYRMINGLTLCKSEHWMRVPLQIADIPTHAIDYWANLGMGELAPGNDFKQLNSAIRPAVEMLALSPGRPEFQAPIEHALHGYLASLADGFSCDVAMSRGPKRFSPLRSTPPVGDLPLSLRTSDFFCCVTPSTAFRERFTDSQSDLVQTLCAYSTRMRYNTWHYLPHTLGIHQESPERDWYFAPSVADVTEWSDQHHTGHVNFGVRHAVRVPFGIEFDGRQLPGLYDLRLMRTDGAPFEPGSLRQAVAASWLLAAFYKETSRLELDIDGFDNEWYRQSYG
ncbi:hypothetical protein ACFWU5_27220 [Nocardia sp. NPDC058640]|uniref:hypothetical protein n=1 Tax=Nocardia sp. NPDC058640 TaxID=3346571 RepID=UPI0036654F32